MANYRISRARRVVENALGILVSHFRVVKDIVFTCGVLHSMLMTHRCGAVTAAYDVASAKMNRQCIYQMRAIGILHGSQNHQRELLKDYFNNVGHWLGRRTGSEICQPTTLGAETGIYQTFSGLTNFSKNFYLSWCCSNFQKISKTIQFICSKLPKYFKSLFKKHHPSYVHMTTFKLKISKNLLFIITFMQNCKLF